MDFDDVLDELVDHLRGFEDVTESVKLNKDVLVTPDTTLEQEARELLTRLDAFASKIRSL